MCRPRQLSGTGQALDVPEGPYAVVVSPAGVFIWRTLKGALHPLETARQRVGWRVAALVVESGKVRRGFFFGKKGQSLLRRLQDGCEVQPLGPRPRTALGLTEYVFRRKAAA